MLDSDLADLYGVPTGSLVQAYREIGSAFRRTYVSVDGTRGCKLGNHNL